MGQVARIWKWEMPINSKCRNLNGTGTLENSTWRWNYIIKMNLEWIVWVLSGLNLFKLGLIWARIWTCGLCKVFDVPRPPKTLSVYTEVPHITQLTVLYAFNASRNSVRCRHISTVCLSLPPRRCAYFNRVAKSSATYGKHAKRGTRNDFQWHVEWIEIQ
jgi:hypothetical protein